LENGFLQNWPRVSEGKKLQFRKRVLMFSVFLLISVFIWLLNALSKDYTSVVEYPLVYTDFPDDRVFVGEMPEHLDLGIHANGYALLRYKVFKKPVPISFKVSAFNLNRPNQDNFRVYILSRDLRGQITSQLPSELQLQEIKPDTLHFEFAMRVSRMVKIKPDFNFEVDKQFTIKDEIRLSQDSIWVSGPNVVLDTLSFIYTERKEMGLLSKGFSEKVRLKEIPELEYDRSKVTCTLELERFTEVQLTIPIEVLNLPDDIVLQTFPSRIKLTCKVGLSKYERMDGNLFRAVVDYAQIDDRSKVANVSVQNIPYYLLSYEYYPKTVEYLKSKR